MLLPLYVFQEDLSQTYHIVGTFASEDTGCESLRLFSQDATYEEHVLYVIHESQTDAFSAFCRTLPAEPPAIIFCSQPVTAPKLPNSLYCYRTGGDFFDCFNRLQQVRDRCNQWDLALTECNSRGAPYREYLEVSYPFLKNPIILDDHDYLIVADSGGLHSMPDDTDWVNLTSAGYWTPDVRTTALMDMGDRQFPSNQAFYYDSSRFFHNFALMNLRENGVFYATICVHEVFTPISKSILFFINHLGLKILPRLREETTQYLQAKDIFDRFLQSILMGNSYREDFIDSRLQLVGWERNCKYCVFAFADSNDVLQSTYFPKRMQNIFRNCRTVPVGNLQVTVVRVQDSAYMRDFPALIAIIRDSVIKCGVSSMLNSFAEIPMGYQQVQAALELGGQIDPTVWMYEYEKYAIDYILKFAMQSASLQMLCHPAVIQLDQEDTANGTCYIDTMDTYLTCEKNLGKIAEQLFIHRNTLMYRLEKIKAITGIDYDETEEMEHILLSIRILRLYKKGIFLKRELGAALQNA